jgi:hypothetical protein
MSDKPHGMTGKKNAVKNDAATSQLQIRCTPAQKATWVHAAGGEKLSAWVIQTLNAAANDSTPTTPPPAQSPDA